MEQHVYDALQAIPSIQKDLELLRKELLGNGQPGRITQMEQDIQELRESRIQDTAFKRGVRYMVDIGVALLASFGYNHFRH